MITATTALRVKDLMRLYGVSENTALKLKRSILEDVCGLPGKRKKHVCAYHIALYEGWRLDELLQALNF